MSDATLISKSQAPLTHSDTPAPTSDIFPLPARVTPQLALAANLALQMLSLRFINLFSAASTAFRSAASHFDFNPSPISARVLLA